MTRRTGGGITLHIVSDLATPHNNGLVRELRKIGGLRVVTWYSRRTLKDLPWKQGLGGTEDNFYFEGWPTRRRLLWQAVVGSEDRFLIVGYSHWMTRVILLWFWLCGRPFMFWTDLPWPHGRRRRQLSRRSGYWLVKRAATRVFVVGRKAVEHFTRLGFREDRLVNLPICVDVPNLDDVWADERLKLRQKYGVAQKEMLCVAGSRLTFEKGYDVLIDAFASINTTQLSRMKLLIVGHGPEEDQLREQVRRLGLDGRVVFEGWLEPTDYERVVGMADVFVHPARFDAFGGGTLYAMAWGVPVIGSDGAGAVIERLGGGVGGLIFKKGDVRGLALCLVRLLESEDERRRMGLEARQIAEQWVPKRAAQIVYDVVRGDG